MTKALGVVLLFIGMSSLASASAVPEIDGGSAASALCLLSGAVLVIRGRKK